MQWGKAFYWILLVLAGLLILLILLGFLIGAFELLSSFLTHLGATITFILLAFFFVRFVIVLAAFPTSYRFVQRILEQSHANELSTQLCMQVHSLAKHLSRLEAENELSRLNGFSKATNSVRKLLQQHLVVFENMKPKLSQK